MGEGKVVANFNMCSLFLFSKLIQYDNDAIFNQNKYFCFTTNVSLVLIFCVCFIVSAHVQP